MIQLNAQYARIGRLHQSSKMFHVPPKAVIARLSTLFEEGALPCINMPYMDSLKKELTELEPYLQTFKHMLVLGIGGSALGAKALQHAFYPEQDRPNHQGRSLWIADNLNTEALEAWMHLLDPKETILVVISKSGDTVETMAQYFILRKWLQDSLETEWSKHILAITDVTKGYLRQEANIHGFRTLPVPDNLGGRYSIFSAVGLAPAAFLGIDWKQLLDGAYSMNLPLIDNLNVETLAAHPAWEFALWAHEIMLYDYDQLIFFNYIPCWSSFGAWFTQLWAESLGKAGKGSIPIPALGVTDQHSLLQMFLDGSKNRACLFLHCPNLPDGPKLPEMPNEFDYLANKSLGEILRAECIGTAAALTQNQVPLMRVILDDPGPFHAGALMALCMTATIFTGWLLDINPVDQPAVELGKRLAKACLLSDADPSKQGNLPIYQAELDILQHFLTTKTPLNPLS